ADHEFFWKSQVCGLAPQGLRAPGPPRAAAGPRGWLYPPPLAIRCGHPTSEEERFPDVGEVVGWRQRLEDGSGRVLDKAGSRGWPLGSKSADLRHLKKLVISGPQTCDIYRSVSACRCCRACSRYPVVRTGAASLPGCQTARPGNP